MRIDTMLNQLKPNRIRKIIAVSVHNKIKFILSGIDIQADLKDGWTPIMLASSSGRPEIVDILIKAGADVNQDHG